MPKEDQGVQLDRYMLIPRSLVFITRNNQVLLIQGAPHKKVWAGKYNGVGGHIERGEDPRSAARRELKEETGLEVSRLDLSGVVTVDTGQQVGISLYIFLGQFEGGELIESREGSLRWVSLEDIHALPLVEDLPVLLDKVIINPPDVYPFSAQYSYDQDGKLMISFGD